MTSPRICVDAMRHWHGGRRGCQGRGRVIKVQLYLPVMSDSEAADADVALGVVGEHHRCETAGILVGSHQTGRKRSKCARKAFHGGVLIRRAAAIGGR